ncbi:MAG TPA: HAD-IC family P-type ATPase [Stellaceae bacterium]|nr:HAD-IC family P-type ATPase [Stellaceae bacterium]
MPVHTAVPGRARFRVAGLRGNAALQRALEAGLLRRAEIRRASASPISGTLVVFFDVAVPLAAVRRAVERLIAAEEESAASEDGAAPGEPAWHALAAEEALRAQQSAPDGLSSTAAQQRLAAGGRNALPELSGRSRLGLLLEQFQGLPVLLLAGAAALSLATGGLLDAVVIVGVVALNAGIGFATQSNTERIIGALRLPRQRAAPLRRDGQLALLPPEQIVPGDILVLRPGLVVPADARVIAADGLTVDEAMLTGESLSVGKAAAAVPEESHLAERTSMVYSGTAVVGGSGVAVAVATGANTEAGRIQRLVGEAQAPETPMQRQLRLLGRQLVLLSGAVCAVVFGIGLLRGQGLVAMLKSSIALAVAALPEGLPTVATTALALGIEKMRHHRVLVRRLDAIETLASVDVIGFDKTGTLTENRMSAAAIRAGDARWSAGSEGDLAAPALWPLLEIAALCNEASVSGAPGAWSVEGTGTEAALLRLALDAGIDVPALRRRLPLTRTQYRREDRPYMITTHDGREGKELLALKGNPDQVLALCASERSGGRRHRLTAERRAAIRQENRRLGEDGLRVLGLASAETPEDGGEAETRRRFCWLGLIGLSDPPRPGSEKLLAQFARAGIRVLILTGDQRATAAALARRLHLDAAPDTIVDSEQLLHLDEPSAAALVARANVFARVTPAEKLRIVRLLQRAGRTVAMAGDGINDSPALRAADVGIVMGRGGAEAARAVADMVLQGDELSALATALARGRATYANIGKSIHFLLATNLSEILLMLVAAASGIAAPLSPIQLLWINLLTDVLPAVGLALEPAEPDVLEQAPHPAGAPLIGRGDIPALAREAAIIATGGLAAYAYGRLRHGATATAGTLAFTSLVGAQLLHALTCRSEHHSLWTRGRLQRNPFLTGALAGSLALQLGAVTLPPMRRLLGLTPLDPVDAMVSVALSLLPYLVNEAAKLRGEELPEAALV